MKIRFLLIVNIMLAFPALSQVQEDLKATEDTFSSNLMLQVSGTSFFENYNSVDFGLIKEISPNRAIGIELGYIFDLYGFNTYNLEEEADWFQNVNGIKVYLQYRFYLKRENEYLNNSRTFFDLEPGFFMMSYDSERIVGYQCNEEFGDCLYYRYFNSEINRFVPKLNLKIGKIYDFDHLSITLFGSVGVHHIFEKSDMPASPEPDKYFFKNGEMNDDLSSGTNVNFRVGVQVGYRFK